MIHKFFVAFIPIFVAIDPIGLVAMFMGLAGNASREHRRREGFIGVFTALCVSVGFVFLGKIIFTALGITVADFQVPGGYCRTGVYAALIGGQSRPRRSGVLERRPGRALDGQTGIARRLKDSGAP